MAAAALKTPTRNGYNAQGVNLTFFFFFSCLGRCGLRIDEWKRDHAADCRCGRRGGVDSGTTADRHKGEKRNRSHTQTHDTNNTTNDHPKNHFPHLTTVEGGKNHLNNQTDRIVSVIGFFPA